MSDMYLGSQAPLYQNVHIQVRDAKTGKVRLERDAKNRVTKLMLWGIARFLSGEYNNSTPDKIYEVIPRYLALGSNKPKLGEDNASVTTAVSVNDTRLLNEYTVQASTGASEPVRRISIQSRQHAKTTTHFTDPFVKLSLSTYINSAQYDGLEIGEAGLFSKETANNCLARVVFPSFTKQEGEVIDIQWDITLLSYGTTKYAESVSIAGPNKIKLGIDYTPYHIVTEHLGLFRKTGDNEALYNRDGIPLFNIDANTGALSLAISITSDEFVAWKEEITALELPYSFIDILNHILSGCIVVPNEDQIYYVAKTTPSILYFDDMKRLKSTNTYLADKDNNLLHDSQGYQLVVEEGAPTIIAQEVLFSYIGVTEEKYNKVYANATLRATASPKDYVVETVTDDKDDSLQYKVIDNQFYERESSKSTKYLPLDAYLYNNCIVDGTGAVLNYTYDSETGRIYQLTIAESKIINTSAFLSKVVDGSTIFKVYKTASDYIPTDKDTSAIVNLGYWIDWDNDKTVYYGDEDIMYHVSEDNYFVVGETYQLKAEILPTDTTDTSTVWTSVNKNVAKINSYGVLHAWNVGETMAIVTTSNNLKARVIVEVFKGSTMHAVENITLEPNNFTIQVDEDDTQRHIVTASIEPPFATYHTVEWKLDDAAAKLVEMTALGNNKVAIHNPTGNVGRGYLIATTQDGKSASCLITTQYESSNSDDCRDECHDEQQA